MGRDEYPGMTTSALDNFIRTRINNPLMITVVVEDIVNKKDAQDTLFLRNDREKPMEATNKMQHWSLLRTELI